MFSMGKGSGHVSGLLSDYMDKQLNAREQAVVEAHLRSCPVCAADLRSLQATVQTLQALPAVAVPRSFVLQPSFQPQRSPSLQLAFLRLAAAVTTAALVLSMAGQVFLRGYPALSPAPTSVAATTDTSALRAAAPAALPTQAAAAPSSAGSTGAGAAPTGTSGERSTLAAPKAAGTPSPDVTQAAALAPATPTEVPAPAAAAPAAPTAAALGAMPPAAAPTATMPAVVAQNVESGPTPPAPTAAAVPVLAAAPAPTPVLQANMAASALSLLQVGLAGLLVVLVLALIIASRGRQ